LEQTSYEVLSIGELARRVEGLDLLGEVHCVPLTPARVAREPEGDALTEPPGLQILLENDDREPSITQRAGNSTTQSAEVTHLAREEDRSGLRPALEVSGAKTARCRGGINDQRHGAEPT
jgi:hypothetical protein